jgi:hypothetical protein
MAVVRTYTHSSIYTTLVEYYKKEASQWVRLQQELVALENRCRQEQPSHLIPEYYNMRKRVQATQRFVENCKAFLHRTEPVASRPNLPPTAGYASSESGARYALGKAVHTLVSHIQSSNSPFDTKLKEVQANLAHFLSEADHRIQERVTVEWEKAKTVLETLLKSQSYPLTSKVPLIGNVPVVGCVINAALRRINNEIT